MINLMSFYGAFSVFTTARASHARQIFIADVLLGTFLCALLPPSGQNHKMLNEMVLLVYVISACPQISQITAAVRHKNGFQVIIY